MTPTYIGDIDLNEETLAHFGVKGMKWGKVKSRIKKITNDLYKKTPGYKKKRAISRGKNIGQHLADDVSTGRYGLRTPYTVSDKPYWANGKLIYKQPGLAYTGDNAKRYNKERNKEVADNTLEGRGSEHIENSPEFYGNDTASYKNRKIDRDAMKKAYDESLHNKKKRRK